MKCCTKCKINKSEDEFQTYFHSTQNKTRMRGACTECFNKQKIEYKIKKQIEKNPDKYYSTKEGYGKCRKCSTWKNLDTDFRGGYTSLCKKCHTEYSKEYRRNTIINKGGSGKIIQTPNKYMDEQQKEQTFMVMGVLGYVYNEKYDVWEKPGYKTINESGKVTFNYEVFNKK